MILSAVIKYIIGIKLMWKVHRGELINSYIITWTNKTDPRPPNNKMWSFKESFLVLILALVSSVRLARAQRIGNDNNIIMSGCASCVLIQYYIPMSRFGDESILHQPGRVQCESLQLCHPNDECLSPRRHLLQVVHRVSAILVTSNDYDRFGLMQ